MVIPATKFISGCEIWIMEQMLNFHTGLAGSLSAVFWKRRKCAGLQVQKKGGREHAGNRTPCRSIRNPPNQLFLPSSTIILARGGF
jgi:hypothetical protein